MTKLCNAFCCVSSSVIKSSGTVTSIHSMIVYNDKVMWCFCLHNLCCASGSVLWWWKRWSIWSWQRNFLAKRMTQRAPQSGQNQSLTPSKTNCKVCEKSITVMLMLYYAWLLHIYMFDLISNLVFMCWLHYILYIYVYLICFQIRCLCVENLNNN